MRCIHCGKAEQLHFHLKLHINEIIKPLVLHILVLLQVDVVVYTLEREALCALIKRMRSYTHDHCVPDINSLHVSVTSSECEQLVTGEDGQLFLVP